MKSKPGFYLSKWYLDLVSDDGDVFIGYHANVKWKSLTFHYSSVLLHHDNKTQTNTSWRKLTSPSYNEKLVRWASDKLGISGEWNSRSNPIKKKLLNDNENFITWNCICPKAEGVIKIGDQQIIGWGYAENLETNIEPWQVPFSELRWGRYISKDNSLVWIDWQGKLNKSWVFVNCAEIKNCIVTDDKVSLPNGSLRLEKFSTIREGTLLTVALKNFPKRFSIFPKNIFNSYESKWLSNGFLLNNKDIDKGWTIHEVVKWN